MNLKHLFELQAKLDERIYKEHPVQEGEDRLAKKILALQVELGELANELPEVFKFWSNKKNNYEKALEELVDCLHFILSIGLELGMDEIADELDLKKFDFLTSNTILSCFIGLSYDIADFYYQRENDDMVPYLYEHILLEFAKLGKMLGFTWDEIEQGYLSKNKINHERQESGY
ncbi:dUTP diphosphatase [Caldibacillus thermolactis]|jgi:dimeric dUTPase (all-alpha-NTP-PPase superfamily)|uniref:dUTP diphosphatase n=1 Tax=Pallidibacillus thermolactis TaxID=251051 RepID=A0ABT2WKT5_9BACI|nr:dUTP diphosphatase [Pallidibacillus thermolactis]MCU9594617.1 dUTP diphosphatase [Pallidibacillus thermolactis]